MLTDTEKARLQRGMLPPEQNDGTGEPVVTVSRRALVEHRRALEELLRVADLAVEDDVHPPRSGVPTVPPEVAAAAVRAARSSLEGLQDSACE